MDRTALLLSIRSHCTRGIRIWGVFLPCTDLPKSLLADFRYLLVEVMRSDGGWCEQLGVLKPSVPGCVSDPTALWQKKHGLVWLKKKKARQ